MSFQIQKDYNKKKKKRYQNEKEDKNSKIDKQEFKNIKHDLNSIINYICLQNVEKKIMIIQLNANLIKTK